MMRRLVVTGLLTLSGLLALESVASAQEIQLTGPLAGAPAVRAMRWHRNKRFEVAPALTFTLLDEYQRTILLGLRANYHLSDWLGLGFWAAFSVAHVDTGLTTAIEDVNQRRWKNLPPDPELAQRTLVDRNASVLNVGKNFPNQLGEIVWVFAPQITAVPFRGKLAIFERAFVDTDIYFFLGPAFVGLKERADFTPDKLGYAPCPAAVGGYCVLQREYATASRTAIAPTFGFGLNFYTNKWTGVGFEYRAMPFSWNSSGFDSRGGPPDGNGPDYKVDSKDRNFRFNQLITVSFSMFLPMPIKSSP